MIIHDIIKIKYSREGYLPNYPYHLTSDREMIEAFTKEQGYFDANYPCVADELQEQYSTLKQYIFEHLEKYLSGEISEILPWVYGYMMGEVISINSKPEDITMLYKYFNMNIEENLDLAFNEEVAINCYNTSDTYIKKLTGNNRRPPCMFGEPHVVKTLRLNQVTII